MQSLSTASKAYLLQFIFAFFVCAAAAGAGFLLLPPGSSATLVWPPTAFAIAILFLYGLDLWPAVTLSLFAVFVWRNGNIPFDFVIAIADTFEALAAAYFLKMYVNLNPLICRLRDGLGLLVASTLPTFIAAGIITIAVLLQGRIETLSQFESMWFSVWIGHTVSALCFAPFLIRWLHRPKFTKTRAEVIEGILIFGSISVLNFLMFWTPYGSIGSVSLIYILLIFLIWASLRSGPRGITLAMVLTSVIAIGGLFYGWGPLTIVKNPQAVFLLQILLGALDMIFLLFATIVEERKQAVVSLEINVNQLEEALQKIKSEDQAKSNFLAILAHELRNPLAPIVTSVELLKTRPPEAEQKLLLETIESHTRTVSLLLDDLLDITRITQNKFELRPEPLVLQKVLHRALESVTGFISARKHSLEVSMPHNEVVLEADPLRLEQILVNLLNNAGKYTDPGGKITITYSREQHMAVVRVSDNGIGISKEKLPGVFEPFGQIGAVVRRPGGLGVGLSLVKRLVELHGGSITAYSAGLGSGSTFTVKLPLKQTRSATVRTITSRARGLVGRFTPKSHMPTEAEVAAAVTTSTKTRILVVDDNEPAAKGLSKLLEHNGHSTTIAGTGEEALQKLNSWNPEVIILDIGLPDIDGYEVAKRIRMQNTTVRLLALTGYGQEEDKIKSREAGFNAHLIKPVSLADIEKALS